MDLAVASETNKRLIVLVPEGLAGNQELAHKVYWMAIRDQSEVLYLVLVDSEEKMLSAARDMATMKAMTAGDGLVVHSKLTKTTHWLRTLHEIYHPGDWIVCHEEQSVKNGFLKTVPITEFLQETLNAAIIPLSGFYHPQQIQIRQWLHSAVAWVGFLSILTVFTALEIESNQIFRGVSAKVALGMLFTIELGAVWVWNNVSGP